MGKLFNPESNLMQVLTRYATIILCGMMWIVCCLPILTIGASTAAMHRMMFNIRQDKPAGIVEFFKAFGREFGKSTLLWLIDALCILLLLFGFSWVSAAEQEGAGSILLLTAFFLPFFLWMLTSAYLFPLECFFDNGIFATIRNAFLVSVRYLRCTIPVLALTMTPFLGYILSPYYFLVFLPIWVMILIPLVFYFQSYFFLKAFTDLIPRSPDRGSSEGSGGIDEVTGESVE